MKNIKLIIPTLLITVTFSACGGDHGANNGKDTAANSYHVTADSSKLDTMRSTGSAASTDNSASGGANLVKKDSTKK